jgi:predicted DNA-binding transcriptional regulator YafY
MISDICIAIHKRQRLQFWYNSGVRVVEPYAYGVGDGGRELLRAYQVSGFSHSREEGWKLFHVDEMHEIEILEEGFEEPRLGYMRNDPTMTKVFCEL